MVIPLQKNPKFKKVPTPLGGGGYHHFGLIPKFRCFFDWKASLSYKRVKKKNFHLHGNSHLWQIGIPLFHRYMDWVEGAILHRLLDGVEEDIGMSGRKFKLKHSFISKAVAPIEQGMVEIHEYCLCYKSIKLQVWSVIHCFCQRIAKIVKNLHFFFQFCYNFLFLHHIHFVNIGR